MFATAHTLHRRAFAEWGHCFANKAELLNCSPPHWIITGSALRRRRLTERRHSAPAYKRENVMQPSETIQPDQLRNYHPACSKCGTTMMLARIEPTSKPGHDNCTFDCPACGHVDSAVLKF